MCHISKRTCKTTTMALRIIQINLVKGKQAQDLLVQTMTERTIDVAIISEPYGKPESGVWYEDVSGKAAILLRNRPKLQKIKEDHKGFVWMETYGYTAVLTQRDLGRLLTDWKVLEKETLST